MDSRANQQTHLLKVENLKIRFSHRNQTNLAVDGIDFHVNAGERIAIVGESGSGKSVTAMALARLLNLPKGSDISGRVLFEGTNTLTMSRSNLRALRGRGISYIFQNPSASLHPQYSVGEQLKEAFRIHQRGIPSLKSAVVEALDEVGIQDPEKKIRSYPHELSGGMLQRVMIAMALACRPKLLIADEPTTALDVTIQARILELIQKLQLKYEMAVVLITHNFGIVDPFSDRLLVMKGGRIVEQGQTRTVLNDPKDAYTQNLINCIPKLGSKQRRLPTMDKSSSIVSIS